MGLIRVLPTRFVVRFEPEVAVAFQKRTCLLLCLAVFLNCADGFADEEKSDPVQITFQMHSSSLPEDSQVFITGNVATLGNWRPDVIQMKLTENHTWTFRLSVPRGTSLQYKYTLGDWGREGADEDGHPLANFQLTATESATQIDHVNAWTNRKPRVAKGQITGELRYHRQIESEGLRPRDVVVWLPPAYGRDVRERYPVLYMHDGQNLFDPKTSAFGIDWQVDETVTELIRTSEISPIMVVGIFNTPDRNREYTLGAKGTRYRQFVINELKPIIDAEYRTKPEREHTFVGGSSAGGLCAFIMAWEHAETFSGALCMSPAFRFQRDNGSMSIDYVSHVLRSPRPEHPLRLYIDNGGRGVDEKLMPGVDAMVEALRGKGLVENRDLRVVIAPEDPHNESAWAKRFPAALKSLFD